LYVSFRPADDATQYRERILNALPKDTSFQPLMTLYLTDKTTADEIRRAKESGVVYAVKLYPAGATTNSAAGVTSLDKCTEALEAMVEQGLPLLVGRGGPLLLYRVPCLSMCQLDVPRTSN
jgi:dihydroorotase